MGSASLLYGALGSAAAVAVLVTGLVEAVKRSFPVQMTAPRCVLLTWATGPLLMLTAWVLGFTPAGLGWHEAVTLGVVAALKASGAYGWAKTLGAANKPE